jgi:hypothetical protein
VQEWNADQAEGGHMLAMNHWGDVSAGEYRALLAGNKKRWLSARMLQSVARLATCIWHVRFNLKFGKPFKAQEQRAA